MLCPACFDRLTTEGSLGSTVSALRDFARVAFVLELIAFFLFFIALGVSSASPSVGFIFMFLPFIEGVSP